MTTAGSIVVDLLMRTGAFETDTGRAEKIAKQRMKAIEASVNNMASTVAIGGTVIAGALLAWVKQAANAADELDQLSERTGVAVETLNGLAYATRLSGGDVAELEKGLQSLNKQISAVAAGDKSSGAMFKALGITAGTAEEALLQLADVFPQLSKQDQVRVGTELLGKSYAALVPLLAKGREGMQALVEEGQRLNPITAQTAKQAAELNDNLDRLKALADSVAMSMGSVLIPKVNELLGEFIEGTRIAGGFVDAIRLFSTTNPFKSAGESVKGLRDELDGLNGDLERYRKFGGDTSAIETAIAATQKRLEFAKYMQRQEALKLGDGVYSNEGRGRVQAPGSIALPSLGGDSKKSKTSPFLDALADEAKTYAAAIDAINKAQLSAQISGQELTATQQRLVELFVDPAFRDMPETWRQTIVHQAESAVAAEKQAGQMKAYLDLVKELRTEEEKSADLLRERLKIIEAISELDEQQRNSTIGRAIAAATSEPPQFAGLAPEIGGAFGELKKVDDAEQRLNEWYQKQLELLAEFREQRADLTAEFDAEELRLKEQHNQQMAQIDEARQIAQLSAAENIFGNLTALTRQFAGEQSEIYRVMFAIEKAAAIARSIVAIQQGIAMAAANPWPMNLAAIASVAAATANIISTISSVNLPTVGARADGGHVSAGMPYLVGERGRELFVPNTAGRIVPNHQLAGGGRTTVNMIEDRRRAGQVEERTNNGGREIDLFVADIMGDGPRSKAVQQAFGLKRRGS